jgi:hypothetical protein
LPQKPSKRILQTQARLSYLMPAPHREASFFEPLLNISKLSSPCSRGELRGVFVPTSAASADAPRTVILSQATACARIAHSMHACWTAMGITPLTSHSPATVPWTPRGSMMDHGRTTSEPAVPTTAASNRRAIGVHSSPSWEQDPPRHRSSCRRPLPVTDGSWANMTARARDRWPVQSRKRTPPPLRRRRRRRRENESLT